MKVISLKHLEHFTPNCSCGTGYSEPDTFEVTLDDDSVHKLVVDIWYRPSECIYGEFKESFENKFKKKCENFRDAYIMYVNEICDKGLCPYTKKQLLQYV